MDLLNIDSNAKTVKGQKKGYMTAVLYLAPYKVSGYQMCPMAERAGCWKTCLNTAGRGGMPVGGTFISPGGIELPNNTIQRARIARTKLWVERRAEFLHKLEHEVKLHIHRATRKGFIPVVRLNGTSDIRWERVFLAAQGQARGTFFDEYPEVQFYDYTKLVKRMFDDALPHNYYLCFSGSGAHARCLKDAERVEAAGRSTVWVARTAEHKQFLLAEAQKQGRPAVDGDEHDLRFLDPPGARVILKAKGSAKKETNGFVLG